MNKRILPRRLKIAVMTETAATIDVVYIYRVCTNYGDTTVLVYDNLIPLGVDAIISDHDLKTPDNVLHIIDPNLSLNECLLLILEDITHLKDIHLL